MITTLCYMKRNGKMLLLYRNKKKNDVNAGKWIGVGGKLERGESPHEGVKREILEETGYVANHCDFRGIVVFCYNDNPPEYMHLYTCTDFSGEMKECDEGELEWVPEEEVLHRNLWEGDRIFLELLQTNSPFFLLSLYYDNDRLLRHELEVKDRQYTSVEVFVPETHVSEIIRALGRYELLKQGFYDDVYGLLDVEGHWTTLEGANPYDGEVGKHSVAREKLMKFRVERDFKELAYLLIKSAHPYESPIINMIDLE